MINTFRFPIRTPGCVTPFLVLWILAVPLCAQQPAVNGASATAKPPDNSNSDSTFRSPVFFAGAQFGSFLRPGARLEVWLPANNSLTDVVFGGAAGRGGYEMSAGVGVDDREEILHLDIRGVFTKQRDRALAGVAVTPMITFDQRVYLRFGFGVSHPFNTAQTENAVGHWDVGVLFRLNK
jgi:hypothetical protein